MVSCTNQNICKISVYILWLKLIFFIIFTVKKKSRNKGVKDDNNFQILHFRNIVRWLAREGLQHIE